MLDGVHWVCSLPTQLSAPPPPARPTRPSPGLLLGTVTKLLSCQGFCQCYGLGGSSLLTLMLPVFFPPGPDDDRTARPWSWEEAGPSGCGRVWRNHLQKGFSSALSWLGQSEGGFQQCQDPSDPHAHAQCPPKAGGGPAWSLPHVLISGS